MTSFILRILFSGLIAFVPNEDGTELTVLLLNADHTHHTSDGSTYQQHNPVLIARSPNCTGDCPKRDAGVARAMYSEFPLTQAQDALETAVDGGGAWSVIGSELTIRKGSTSAPDLPPLVYIDDVRGTVNGEPALIPATANARRDFSWIANLRQICTGCNINPALLGSQPPAGIVAARLRLKSGNVFTYSVARLGANVTPVHFKRLDGTGSASPYTQAVASWVAADITVTGSDIEIVDTKLDGSGTRSMKLTPDSNGRVEVAVLNLPPFVPPASPHNDAPQVGKHFEMFYELSETPPALETRLVPRAGAASSSVTYPAVDWHSVHPQSELWSDLLNLLRLNAGRTVYDRLICPPVTDPFP